MAQRNYDRIGYIQCFRTQNPTGKLERIEYEWKGPEEVLISVGLLDEMKIPIDQKMIDIGPFRLALIESNPYQSENHYIRVDYPLWWLRVWWHKASKTLDIIYRRLILTLAVWGLADYHVAEVPSWRDIHGNPKMKYISVDNVKIGEVDVWLNGRNITMLSRAAFVPVKEGVWWFGWADCYVKDGKGFKTDPLMGGFINIRKYGLVRWKRTKE